jgi:uncharacterized membrane protein YkvA (DUF1232 family)
MVEKNNEYSDETFWGKLRGYAVAAGQEVVEKALTLYYCHQDGDTPTWAKTVIIGALAYFILPADAIPDFIPGAGYTDDLGALAAALATLAAYIKKEHSQRARETLSRWFPKKES